MSDTVELKTKGLDKLIKAMKGKIPTGRVGILGSGSSRASEEAGANSVPTNAEIGAKHEYGDSETPQRSFLRVPLMDNLETYLEKAGAFEKTSLKEVIKLGTFKPYIEKMTLVGETVVHDAFQSRGFGKWKPWSPGYTNNTGQILVDTQQLRNSISSDVK